MFYRMTIRNTKIDMINYKLSASLGAFGAS
jgi:hypothetical protein